MKIVNPPPGVRSHCTRERAERYRRRGEAHFDSAGRLVFNSAGFAHWASTRAVSERVVRGVRHSPRLRVASGYAVAPNALSPDLHGVMPVSPEWLNRMGY